MFGSEVLEIAIGLIFVYVLFSVLVTLINEYLNAIFRLRAKNLRKIIKQLLDDEGIDNTESLKLSEKFIEHPGIKYLSRKKHKYPSYLASEKFAKVVLDIIRTDGDKDKIGNSSILDNNSVSNAIDRLDSYVDSKGITNNYSSDTLRLMKSFAKEADEDIADFGKKLESWFNETVERGQGWYNRRIKWITLVVGFVLTFGLNVDTIHIYKTLSENEGIRAEIIESAGTYLNDSINAKSDNDDLDKTRENLNKFYKNKIVPSSNLLGIGWTCEIWNNVTSSLPKFFLSLLGWLITAFAISLGAPFWFDVLNKVMKLRSSIQQTTRNLEKPKKQPVG